MGGAPEMTAARTARRLALGALALAYLQIVFGAIVRITGSGMGCGDHWPKCLGRWFPPLDRADLVIEVTHRYIAAALTLSVIALAIVAFTRRQPGAPDLRKPAVSALVTVVAAALLGAVTVKLVLAPTVVVAHLTLAMLLLAVLAWIALRTGAFGAAQMLDSAPEVGGRTRRAATAAAALALAVVLLGALTANVPAAAGSCYGFPHCREIFVGGTPLWIHVTHRVLAFALLFHAVGHVIGVRRRAEPLPVRRAAAALFAIVLIQVLVAAAMVEMRFPAVLRSLHQALGALIWLTAFILAALPRIRPVAAPRHE